MLTWRVETASDMGSTAASPGSCNPCSRRYVPLHHSASGPVLAHATYNHQRPSGPAQVLWWPCTSQHPRTILLFIPGNPGLLDFYIPFLDTIYHEANSSITIFAHAHLGLSSYIGGDRSFPDVSSVSLPAQTQA